MTKLSVIITNSTLGSPQDIRIAKRPIIDRQIEVIEEVFPGCDIMYVGDGKTQYEFPRTIVNKQSEIANTAYSVHLGIKKARYRKILIVSAETVFNKAALNIELDKQNKIIVEDSETDYLGCSQNNGRLNNICFGLPYKWSGLFYIASQDIHVFKQICNNRRIFLFEAINELLKYTDIEMVVPPRAKSVFIKQSSDIERAKKIR